MPEGDSVFVAAARLDAALRNQELSKTDFRVPRYATVDLSGRRIEGVVARGKHILTRIEGGTTLHTHFKMEGSWHLYRPGERWRYPASYARVVLETEPWYAVGFRLGIVDLMKTEREDEALGHLGPDLLGSDWDESAATANLRAQPSDRPIGEVLIDQTVMAGLGNVYKSEICFLLGLYPWTPVGDVDVAKAVRLSKRVIEANRSTGMQITTGDARRGRQRWVYGRKSEACRRCGTAIEKRDEVIGMRERVTYWCPDCQPVRRPGPGAV